MLPQRPAQRLLIDGISTARNPRLIRWKRHDNGTAQQQLRTLERECLPRKLQRRRTFGIRNRASQPNGRFALTRAMSVLSTHAALPSRRLRFAFFVDNKWRREERVLKILPRAVILKRFATDLRVLLRAMAFGIG